MKVKLQTLVHHIPEEGDPCYVRTCNGEMVFGKLGKRVNDGERVWDTFEILFGNDETGWGCDSARERAYESIMRWDRKNFAWEV